MPKKTLLVIIIFTFIVLLLTGCDKDENLKGYITLMSVPPEATIPEGLHLDSILSITNTDPNNPEAEPTAVQLGVFGFTNKEGVPEYYVYGKKQSVSGEQTHLIEQGFYPVNFSRDSQNIALSLKQSASPLDKVDSGKGTPAAYNGELPFGFYTPSEQTGVYTFADPSGKTIFRIHATFLGKNGNFFPASEDGQMIPGSLPVDKSIEETIQSQGTNAASRLLTTPINCTNIQTYFEV